MATSRGNVLASAFDGRQTTIDFADRRDSFAQSVRQFCQFAQPLLMLLISGVVLVATVMAAATIWPAQPLVAGALGAAVWLGVAGAGICWWLVQAKHHAEIANAAKTRLLTALGEDLRKPLRDIARAGAAIDRNAFEPGEWDKITRMRLDARAMLLQLEDIRTCLDIESGGLAPETRSFDLYRLVNGVVASLRPQAAERGVVLTLRIDPLVPYQLRGWPHQLRQVLIGLLAHVLQRSDKSHLRITLDAEDVTAEGVSLRIAVGDGTAAAPAEIANQAAAGGGSPFGMAMVQRLAGLMSGRLMAERQPNGGSRFTVELPFAVDRAASALPLDLAHLPALIVTKDQDFVGEFVEPLDSWRAETRWIGAGETALDYLASFDAGGRRPLLIVDGRGDVLQALSFAHRAVSLPAGPPPYLLFVVDESRMDSVIGLADEDFDGILPSPFTVNTLRGALHAMRVEPADWFLADGLSIRGDEEGMSAPAPSPTVPLRPIAALEPAPKQVSAAVVTEIASHPRFAESSPAVIDERAIAALWSLGDGGEFFVGVIDAFRADARRVIAELNAAATAIDPRRFEEGVQALRRCTANFGGGRLRELLLSLQNLAPAELQRQGSAYVRRLETEIGKLEATLLDYAKAAR